ncbi:PTS lactose/cellobiose transporter subunit IIA [Clostridium amazonitimonense]|uniref:PTS lactose/cellobiose transporter subunit IIA n=1 Tax=Clostridium amazonitimonense TaxID=1499689 RepID=UPI00050949FC|nr:PTS lactose/cellobiose transporter subunit IIA [Clostridium amazonitimonense]
MEQIILNLIMNSGDARSYAMEAIQSAKDGDFNTAEDLMKKCNEQLDHAHYAQTSLIQSEASGNKTEFSLLLVHAQDHLMTTLTLKDLALEIIDIHKRIDAK